MSRNYGSGESSDLRKRAEEKARERVDALPENLSTLPEEGLRLFHELRVHQIELEMQNEELRRAQMELEAARARYFDLYNLAPVGYFTLSEKGLILQANLTVAGLLGVVRSALVKQPLSRFILSDDQDTYYRFRKRLFETGAPQVFELRIVNGEGSPFWARMEVTVAQDDESGAPVCRAVMSDITERKQAEEQLQQARDELEQRVADQTEELRGANEGLRREITEHKRAEEALGTSEKRYRQLHESMMDGFALVNMDGMIKEYNESYREMVGYTPDELLKLTYRDLTPEKWHVLEQRIVNQQIMTRGYSEVYEKEYRKKNGTIFPVELRTFLIKDETGKKIGVWAIVRDITERKQAEKALRDEKDRAQKYLDVAGVMLIVLDADQKVTLINRKGCEVLGYREEEIIGQKWHDHFLPERCREEVTNAAAKLFAGNIEPVEYLENPVLTKSGEEKVIAWHNTVLRDGAGNIICTLSSGEDITERKRAEEALRESEERFRDLYDNAPVGYHEYDLKGQITRVNQTDLEMLGYTREEIIGHYIWELNVEGEILRSQVLAKLADVLPPGGALERTYRRKDGSTFPVLIQDRLVRDEEGRIKSIRCTIQDITDRKRAEEDLRVSLEKYRILFESFPLGITISDKSGKIIESNRQSEYLLGITCEAQAQRKIDSEEWQTIRKDGTPMPVDEHASTRALRENHLIENVEMGIVKDKGEITWISVTSAPIPLEGYGVAITYGDITERKRMADELHKSQAFLKSILDNAPMPIYVNSADHRYLLINKAWEEFIGKNREEVIGLPFVQVFPADTGRAFMKRNENVLESGLPYVAEEQVPTPLGPLYFHTVRFPLTGADGGVESIGSISVDVTERKQSEEKIKGLTQFLRAVIDNADVWVHVSDEKGNVLIWNKAAVKISGYSSEEVIGHDKVREWLYPDEVYRKRFVNRLGKVLQRRGEAREIESVIRTRAGEDRTISWYSKKLQSDKGNPIGSVVLGIDITERKKAEKQGEKLLEQLKLGRTRLQHLSQRLVELQESERRDLARELHDKVGQSLTALIINLKIIQNLLPEESRNKVSARIDDSRKLVEETVMCIRDVMARLRPPDLDDYGLLAALRWYSKQLVERTGIVVEVRGEELNPRLPLKKETALFRIVQEALTNMAKYAKASRVTLILEGGDGKGRLTIADDGIGFDSKTHHQPGSRPEWGMINMRERAESIGGEFHIETAPEKGTKIIVEVPRKE